LLFVIAATVGFAALIEHPCSKKKKPLFLKGVCSLYRYELFEVGGGGGFEYFHIMLNITCVHYVT
jgi:hypothetical protein